MQHVQLGRVQPGRGGQGARIVEQEDRARVQVGLYRMLSFVKITVLRSRSVNLMSS